MHARVMHVTMKPECLDEARARWPVVTESFKELGLKCGYMVVLDREAGKVLSVTVWDSLESIQAQENSAEFKAAMAPFHAFFAADPWSEYGEIGAHVD